MHNNYPLRNMTVPEAVEKKAKYEAMIKTASLAFLDEKNYTKASMVYSEALTLANDLHIGDMKICILKYMICSCLVESNKLEDLAEVVMILQNINKTLKERFPAIFCVLAQAHCKLYRFDYALESLKAADTVFKKNQLLETFYIPGTTTLIEQNQNSNMWFKVKEESACWRKPDAICASTKCNHITKPYVTPNKNIYKSDPAFSGMVIIHCNNKKRPCILNFHPSCWKVMKDETNLVQKVTDKDMLEIQCFTPNCMDDNVSCRISFIEVIGQNGEVKAQVRKPPSESWPTINKTVSKGAIKKQRAIVKTAEHSLLTPQKEHVPVVPKNEFDVKKKIGLHDGYDENQLLTVVGDIPNSQLVIDNSPDAGEKAFLFSFFHHYVKHNLVRVCDLYTKFAEIKSYFEFLKDIDILTFLLDTNLIVAMDDKSMRCSEDVGEMLDDLINDDDFTDTVENNKKSNNNNISGEECLLNTGNGIYKEEAAATNGDTSSNYSSVNTTIDVNLIKKAAENQKLKEYIVSLKKEMKDLIEENYRLKKEMGEKDYKIEVFLKQMDECEALYEKMTDFKARYDEIKDENFKLKEEIIVLINDKKLLKEEVAKLNDSETRRKEIKQTFQAEYNILQKCINASWEKKTEELKASLKHESEAKKSLISQYLKIQFNANKNLLNGYVEQCTIALDVISKINSWMEKCMYIKCFKDNTEWVDRLNHLQQAIAELKSDFTNMSDKLNTEECPATVCLECPTVPDTSLESLSDIVLNALNTYYTSQYELVKNLMQKQQQQQQQLNQQHQHQLNQQLQQQQWQQQQLQTQQLQRSAAYNLHVYPYAAQQQLQQPALPFAAVVQPHATYQVPSPNLQPPLIQKPPYSQTPVVQNTVVVPITKSSIEIKELNSSSNENLSESAASSSTKDDINDRKIKEETKTDSNKSVKTNLKEEVKTEVEEPIESIDTYFNKLSERREQMRKALKEIALNVEEKSKSDTVDEKQTKQYMNDNSALKVEEKIGETNSLQLEICDNKTDVTSVTSKGDNPKSKKITGINSLIKVMQKKYPGTLEVDIIEIIMDIRKKNNNTLTGKLVSEILNESEEYFLRNQRIHVMRYYLNDGSKSSCSESSNNLPDSTQQSSFKDRISPASNISDKFLNGIDTSSVQKKAWNIIPQEEAKWTVSGEIECSICMSFIARRNCYTLNCRHSFHTECIKKWLKSDRSCPNCRVIVTDDDEFPPLPA